MNPFLNGLTNARLRPSPGTLSALSLSVSVISTTFCWPPEIIRCPHWKTESEWLIDRRVFVRDRSPLLGQSVSQTSDIRCLTVLLWLAVYRAIGVSRTETRMEGGAEDARNELVVIKIPDQFNSSFSAFQWLRYFHFFGPS